MSDILTKCLSSNRKLEEIAKTKKMNKVTNNEVEKIIAPVNKNPFIKNSPAKKLSKIHFCP